MKFGKTIKIFLIDGEPNGRMTCELSNWTGKAYKIPRIKIKDCYNRLDLKSTGIYLLFGKNEEGEELAYIGESESILDRLNQHLETIEFWNETIAFVSKDENLNKAHIKYLENRLYEIAKKAKRHKIMNKSIPTQSSISESDRAEMEEYIENIKLLVNTLGHRIFDERREQSPTLKQEVFRINTSSGARAQGEPTTEGFVVLKASKAIVKTGDSINNSFLKLRESLTEKGILKLSGDFYEFEEDYLFSSPSAAATFIKGSSANGLIEWKLPNGKTLKEFEMDKRLGSSNTAVPN